MAHVFEMETITKVGGIKIKLFGCGLCGVITGETEKALAKAKNCCGGDPQWACAGCKVVWSDLIEAHECCGSGVVAKPAKKVKV
tara:strand:- start:180 stop:431 length:252 start_codon:yes stop_codon:yes gene_type:complete